MTNYKYYPEFNSNEELLWMVKEQATSQILAEFFFEDDAAEFTAFLNSGGGFAGFTPKFILTEVPKTNLNDEFLSKFA